MSQEYKNFRQKILKGASWLAALHWISRALSIISLLILARILTPDDFGVAALAMVSLMGIQVLGGFSFDFAIIKDKHAERPEYDTAWTLSILRCLILALVLILGSGEIADFFGEPRLGAVLQVLAIPVLFDGFGNIGTVEFRKELQYKKFFVLQFSERLCQILATLLLAIITESYWALIGGVVIGRTVKLGLSFRLHPYRPRLSLSRWKKIMRFSRWLVVGNIINYIYNQFPVIVLGKTISSHSLGIFHMGQEIATFPTVKVISPVVNVIFPGLSKIVDDKSMTDRTIRDFMAILSFIVFPAAIGLSCIAEEIVPALLGATWLEVTPILQIIAIYGLFRVWQFFAEMIFLSQDKAHLLMYMRLLGAIVQVAAIIIGVTYWGVLGAGFGMTIAAAVASTSAIFAAMRILRLNGSDLVRAVWRPVFCTAVMVGVLFIWKNLSAGTYLDESQLIDLFLTISFGASGYLFAHSLVSMLIKTNSDIETDVMQTFVFPRLRFR